METVQHRGNTDGDTTGGTVTIYPELHSSTRTRERVKKATPAYDAVFLETVDRNTPVDCDWTTKRQEAIDRFFLFTLSVSLSYMSKIQRTMRYLNPVSKADLDAVIDDDTSGKTVVHDDIDFSIADFNDELSNFTKMFSISLVGIGIVGGLLHIRAVPELDIIPITVGVAGLILSIIGGMSLMVVFIAFYTSTARERMMSEVISSRMEAHDYDRVAVVCGKYHASDLANYLSEAGYEVTTPPN